MDAESEPTTSGPSEAAIEDAVRHFWTVVYHHRLRTSQDRLALAALFAEHFPPPPGASGSGSGSIGSEAKALRVTPGWVRIGRAVLPRGRGAAEVASGGARALA
eukprot:8958776-Pyramimonas_sp.AAC.1